METYLFDRGAMENKSQYTLNNDKVLGLKNSVNNGQIRLALEYSQSIILDLVSRISDLENKISLLTPQVQDEKLSVDSKKPTKTTRTTSKVAPSEAE